MSPMAIRTPALIIRQDEKEVAIVDSPVLLVGDGGGAVHDSATLDLSLSLSLSLALAPACSEGW